MKIVLPFPPSLNMMYPTNRQGRRFLSKRGAQFKKDVSVLAIRLPILKGELAVKLKLFRPKKIGDIDNYSKGVLDSLKGICFNDDSQITELHILRFDDKANPRVEIEIIEKEIKL